MLSCSAEPDLRGASTDPPRPSEMLASSESWKLLELSIQIL
jgi:hypothetical protein